MSNTQDQIYQFALMEIKAQGIFAQKAFENITKKGEGNDVVTFSSIHSFLTHCANISKILWSTKPREGNESIKNILNINVAERLGLQESSPIWNRDFRDDLDHYDERLVKWIKEYLENNEVKPMIFDFKIGQKAEGNLYIRNYDPITKTYTFANKDLDLGALYDEIIKIQKLVGGPIIQEANTNHG